MKKIHIFLMGMLMSVSTLCKAQEYNIPYVSIHEISNVWDKTAFCTIGNRDKANIKSYFLTFASTFPNDFFTEVAGKMMGLESDNISNYVCDTKSGYLKATWAMQIESQLQMCYWRCTDGSRLVAVVLQGCSEALIDPDFDGNEEAHCTNLLLFYKLSEHGCWDTPLTLKALCGRDFHLYDYDIQLPQQGKDILLKANGNNKQAKSCRLKWNGNGFNVA